MTRKECLDEAAKCVLQDRQNQYGGPENNFERIAEMWSAYLGNVRIHSWDVAAMMGMLKLARARFNPKYADNWVDLAGYAACGAECATAQEEFDKALDEFQKKSLEHMFKKAECVQTPEPEQKPDELVVLWKHKPKAEGVEKPKFKPGDKVQVRVTLPSVSDRIWVDGTYARHDRGSAFPHAVYNDAGFEENVKDEDIRPAPKAEGVEELVVSPFDEDRMRESMPGIVPQDGPSGFDAPRTKEELYDRIVANNPAVFGCAHKPTGEELAEMAQEAEHE